jgi:hypothetical protein
MTTCAVCPGLRVTVLTGTRGECVDRSPTRLPFSVSFTVGYPLTVQVDVPMLLNSIAYEAPPA